MSIFKYTPPPPQYLKNKNCIFFFLQNKKNHANALNSLVCGMGGIIYPFLHKLLNLARFRAKYNHSLS